MSIILDPNKQLIAIESYYIEKKRPHGNSIFHFIKSKDELKDWQDLGYVMENSVNSDGTPIVNDKIIHILQTHWKTLSWRDQNTVFSKSIRQVQKPDGSFASEIDTIAFRDWKLKTCLKKWNLTDANNQILDVSDGLIDNLDPLIAQEMLSEFEKVTEPNETDLK